MLLASPGLLGNQLLSKTPMLGMEAAASARAKDRRTYWGEEAVRSIRAWARFAKRAGLAAGKTVEVGDAEGATRHERIALEPAAVAAVVKAVRRR